MLSTSSLDSWIFCPKPNPCDSLRLICLPYAGGGAAIFRSWPDNIPAEIEVVAIRLPGRENRLGEQPFTQIVPLVEALGNILFSSSFLNAPFAIFGHSMGSLVGFELARYFRKFGIHPKHLFISGCRAPHLPASSPLVSTLAEDQLIKKIRAMEGIPDIVLSNKEYMQLIMPTLRADFAVHEAYEFLPDLPLNCSISAFGGLRDLFVNRTELVMWKEYTTNSFSLNMFDGNHFFLHTQQAELLKILASELLKVPS